MRKIKWHVLVLALLVWLMSGMLSGCLVRIDPETGGQERQIYEKPIKEGVSGGEEDYTGQADVPSEGEESVAQKQDAGEEKESVVQKQDVSQQIDRDGFYTDKEQVALYIHLYGRLPGNYISKNKAEKLGWDSAIGRNFCQRRTGESTMNAISITPEATGEPRELCTAMTDSSTTRKITIKPLNFYIPAKGKQNEEDCVGF